MKRVAFDIQGTLRGAHSKVVRQLFDWFESKGCKMYVWTNGGFGMALDTINELDLNAEAETKYSVYDLDLGNKKIMDIAVEDDSSQDYLAAKSFIWVSDITNSVNDFEKEFGHLLT